MSCKKLILLSALTLAFGLQAGARAQAPATHATGAATSVAATSGTLVIVPAFGEVKRANDEATLSFSVEEQDKDRAAATARVNQKIKQGTDILRRADAQAELKTVNYTTYPVYPEIQDSPRPLSAQEQAQQQAARRTPIGWRVSQTLEMKTHSLAALPRTVAAAQKVLNLNGIDYHLSPALEKQVDDERIAATYRNLNERIASIARAMGRSVNDAVIDTVDFEGSGNYAGPEARPAAPMMRSLAKQMDADVPEPSFEPGETTLQMRLVGKVRFR
ncbi:SIMPL domain-containing protein [Massilia sp. 9096]|uniref:SIMPL domain-containing protein n=1 Tax=Massilia sp. 9096 TaxID=1500894 RepID=UPI00056A5D27|nr:SIMPL domain-containing protein [Massilia sp. 9096]